MTSAALEGTELVVLTGFLGTGKTTLLADFLEQPEATDTAVIINEVGQINIDGAVIAETGRSLPVALLSNGCVCCTVTNDLLFTIEALLEGRRDAGLPPFRRIVLECSGLSRPAAVLRTLGDLAHWNMRARVVATRDAKASPFAAGFDDAASQLAAAHAIVLTKTEGVAIAERERLAAELRHLNPFAELIVADDRRLRTLAAFDSRRVTGSPHGSVPAFDASATAAAPHPRIGVLLATFAAAQSWSGIQDWLENLVGLCGDRLLRLKGILHVADVPEPVLIQAVGNMFSPPQRMSKEPSSGEGLVIIARDLRLEELRAAGLARGVVLSRGISAPARGRLARRRAGELRLRA